MFKEVAVLVLPGASAAKRGRTRLCRGSAVTILRSLAVIVERTIDGPECSQTLGSKFEKKLYVALGEPGPIEERRAQQAIVAALADAGGPLTVKDLAKAFPDIALPTINRALKALVPASVERAGTGKRGSPCTYTLKPEVSSQTSISGLT